MSAQQSNLSDPKYGYDFVVATTQKSINLAMKEYLTGTAFPVVQMYWNQNPDTQEITPVAKADLMVQTNNVDPLKIGNWKSGDPITPEITSIQNSNFYCAFEAQIGISAGIPLDKLADIEIVTLQQNSDTVVFNLMCSEFTIVSCTYGKTGMTFTNISQPSNTPWIFTSNVKLTDILNNDNLPPDVEKQLNNLGAGAFSVQQLLFDLDNAAIESTPVLTGVDDNANTLINKVFITHYFNSMKASKQPVLRCAIVPTDPNSTPISPVLKSMAFEVSPYIDPTTKQPANVDPLNTLNYLCSVDNNTPPTAYPFTWNWIESGELAHGVVATSKKHFVDYFTQVLTPLVAKNCFATSVSVYTNGGITGTTHYEWTLTSGQTPTVTFPATGSNVINFHYDSTAYDDSHQGAAHQFMGGLTISPSYDVSVSFVNDTIIIVQNLKMYVAVHGVFNTYTSAWNPVNTTITDTYNIAIGPNGYLTTSLTSVRADNPDPTPHDSSAADFFNAVNGIANSTTSWLSNLASSSLSDIPVELSRAFVFPGGKTFSYTHVAFSDNLDLVTHITYADPSSN